MSEEEFRRRVETELSTGLGDPRGLRTLLRQIDDLHREEINTLHNAYQQSGVGRIVLPVRNLETEVLTPPEWIDAFINLVSRFLERAHVATDLIRWIDLWAAGLLAAPPQSLKPDRNDQFQPDLDLLIGFLTRHWRVPAELFVPIVGDDNVGSLDDSRGKGTGVEETVAITIEQGLLDVPDEPMDEEPVESTQMDAVSEDAVDRPNLDDEISVLKLD